MKKVLILCITLMLFIAPVTAYALPFNTGDIIMAFMGVENGETVQKLGNTYVFPIIPPHIFVNGDVRIADMSYGIPHPSFGHVDWAGTKNDYMHMLNNSFPVQTAAFLNSNIITGSGYSAEQSYQAARQAIGCRIFTSFCSDPAINNTWGTALKNRTGDASNSFINPLEVSLDITNAKDYIAESDDFWYGPIQIKTDLNASKYKTVFEDTYLTLSLKSGTNIQGIYTAGKTLANYSQISYNTDYYLKLSKKVNVSEAITLTVDSNYLPNTITNLYMVRSVVPGTPPEVDNQTVLAFDTAKQTVNYTTTIQVAKETADTKKETLDNGIIIEYDEDQELLTDENGYITIPEGGGTIIYPDGREVVVPEGTIVMPDGTLIVPEDNNTKFRVDKWGYIHVEGGDATVIRPDGTEVDAPEGTIIMPDATVIAPKDENTKLRVDKWGNIHVEGGDATISRPGKDIEAPEGTIIMRNGTIIIPKDKTTKFRVDEFGYIHVEDGDAKIIRPDGTEIDAPNGSIIMPDGTVIVPDKGTELIVDKEGNIIVTGGGATIYYPDGRVVKVPAGTIISSDGKITEPENPETGFGWPFSIATGILIIGSLGAMQYLKKTKYRRKLYKI